MKNAGFAHMGVGSAKGQDKSQLASMAAISSPLLETSIAGATGVLLCITASQDITLDDVNLASQLIREEAHPDANIIWGATFDPNLEDEMRITIIATGFASCAPTKITDSNNAEQKQPAKEIPSNDNIYTQQETPSQPKVDPVIKAIEEVAKSQIQEEAAQAPEAAPVSDNTLNEKESQSQENKETIITKIPTKNNVKDTYGGYDDLFNMMRKKNKK